MEGRPFYGYHENAEGAVILTHRCRTIGVVRSSSRIHALRRELAEQADRQSVIARWAAELNDAT